MTDTPVLDQKNVEKLAEEKALEQASAIKQDLINALGGEKPEEAPKSWTDLRTNIKEEAVSEAEQRILDKLKKEREEEKAAQVQTIKEAEEQKKLSEKKNWEDMSAQWREAVQDGLLPDIKPEVKTVIEEWQKGTGRAPTQEEFDDPGLKAFTEARALHEKLNKEGKSSTFYRTIQREMTKQPAGAHAPVLGNTSPVSSEKGQTYQETKAIRKRLFGF